MGWIQAWAYRERYVPRVSPPRPVPWDRQPYEEPDARSRQEGARPPRDKADAPPADTKDEAPESRAADGKLQKRTDGLGGYPGTGWGSQASDPATVVRFDAQPAPADVVTLRYEYAPALQALGVLPPRWERDRLSERERGDGFARSPAW